MVAITVILAAVIAASVLGFGDTNDLAPQVTFDYDYNETSNNLTVTATGGEQFDPGAVNVTGDPGDANGVDANDTYGGITDNSPSGLPDGEQISAGDDFTVASEGDDAEIRIFYESGGNSNQIGNFQGPGA